MRPSDEILEALNRLNKAKETGVYGSKELSELLIKLGDMGANAYRLGKINSESAQNIMDDIPANDYIGNNKDMSRAKATVKQAFAMAGLEVDQKNVTVEQKQKEYTKTASNIAA